MFSAFFSYYYLKHLPPTRILKGLSDGTFILQSLLRQVYSYFQSDFSTECDLRSASYFNFQYLIVSFMSSSSCLLLLPCLPIPPIFPSIMCLEGSSYKICDKYSYISFLLLYIEHSFPSWLCVILLQFSYERPNWSFTSFSRTTFKNFPGISDILSKESNFQHHKILCSKCRIY